MTRFALLFLFLLPPAVAQTTLRWSQAGTLTGKHVEVEQGGTLLVGYVLGASNDALQMRVDKPRAAAGERSIPRTDITRLRVERRGVRGRVIGTTAGAALGTPVFIADGSNAGYGALAMLLYGAIGYGLGSLGDRKQWEEIVFLPVQP